MFKLLLYFYIVLFFHENYVNSEILNVMNALKKKSTDLKSYQVTILTKKTVFNMSNFFFENFSAKMPVVVVDSKENLSQSMVSTKIKLSRSSNLYILLQDELVPEDILISFKNINQLSPIKTRTKYLVIFNDEKYDYNEIQSILLNGWLKQFLDFSILNLRSGEIFAYNPFSKIFGHHSIFSNQIFPNKLKNMEKYSLQAPVGNFPPYFIRTIINNVTKNRGLNVDIYKFFESALNFKMNFILQRSIGSVVKKVEDSDCDLSPGPITLLISFSKKLEIGIKVATFHDICAVIAYSSSREIESSINKLKLLSNIIFAFITATLIHRILVIIKIESDIFEYIRLLLGQSVMKNPTTVKRKLIFLFLGLFSMIFFPDIVAQLTQVIVSSEEKSISTYKDILEADLQPRVHLEDLDLRHTDSYLEDIKSKNIDSEGNEEECLKMAIRQEKVVCIVSTLKAEMYMRKYKRSDGSPLLKKTDVDFPKSPETLFFPPASPYVEVFDKLYQTLLESGILKKIRSQYFNVPADDDINIIEDKSGLIVITQCLSIFIFGCTISAVVFIIEFMIRFYANIKAFFLDNIIKNK